MNIKKHMQIVSNKFDRHQVYFVFDGKNFRIGKILDGLANAEAMERSFIKAIKKAAKQEIVTERTQILASMKRTRK